MKLEKNGIIKEISNPNEINDYIAAGYKEYKKVVLTEKVEKVNDNFKAKIK